MMDTENSGIEKIKGEAGCYLYRLYGHVCSIMRVSKPYGIQNKWAIYQPGSMDPLPGEYPTHKKALAAAIDYYRPKTFQVWD